MAYEHRLSGDSVCHRDAEGGEEGVESAHKDKDDRPAFKPTDGCIAVSAVDGDDGSGHKKQHDQHDKVEDGQGTLILGQVKADGWFQFHS